MTKGPGRSLKEISAEVGVPPDQLSAIVLRAFDAVVMERLSELTEPVSITVNLSKADTTSGPRNGATVRKPSRTELHGLVTEAQAAIEGAGGAATRPPPKRQQIDRISYAYGLMWGAACALDVPLKDIVARFGRKHTRRRRRAPRAE